MTAVAMSPELLAKLGREVEQVTLVKVEAPPTPGKVARLSALAGSSLALLGGPNGHFLLEELERGAIGAMPGCDMTDAFVRDWNLWKAVERRRPGRVRSNDPADPLRAAAPHGSGGDEAEPLRRRHHRQRARPAPHAQPRRRRHRGRAPPARAAAVARLRPSR
jgi:hypothetical protein